MTDPMLTEDERRDIFESVFVRNGSPWTLADAVKRLLASDRARGAELRVEVARREGVEFLLKIWTERAEAAEKRVRVLERRLDIIAGCFRVACRDNDPDLIAKTLAGEDDDETE